MTDKIIFIILLSQILIILGMIVYIYIRLTMQGYIDWSCYWFPKCIKYKDGKNKFQIINDKQEFLTPKIVLDIWENTKIYFGNRLKIKTSHLNLKTKIFIANLSKLQCDGLYRPLANEICLDKFILPNKGINELDWKQTLCHEFVHYIQHNLNLKYLEPSKKEDEAYMVAWALYGATEWLKLIGGQLC